MSEDRPTYDTPASRWREEGKPDPFGDRYNCARADLEMGDLTDDELANEVFLYDHRSGLKSMAYLQAMKDRIRWLSRQVARTEIEPLPLRRIEHPDRDLYGQWAHPDMPDFGEDTPAMRAWIQHKGLTLAIRQMLDDVNEDMADRYGDGDISVMKEWEPEPPEGKGWFLLAVTDTEDGPMALWVREAA